MSVAGFLAVLFIACYLHSSIQQTTVLLDKPATPPTNATTATQTSKPKFRISWVLFPGWIPLDYAQYTGVLAKHAAAEGIEIEFVALNSYINSITKFVSREVDGFVAPIGDLVALPLVEHVIEQTRLLNKPDIPSLPPLSPVVVFSGSSSEGADAILSKEFTQIAQLQGQDVHLETGTVSQYFLYRALQLNNMTLDDVNMVNSPIFDQVADYESGDADNIVNWYPFIGFAQEAAGGNILFTTKEMSKEIVDVMVIHSEVLSQHPGLGRALTAAFFEITELMKNSDAESEAIQWMGARQNTTAEEFLLDMDVIQLFLRTPRLRKLHIKRLIINYFSELSQLRI
eukprot:TRINITY_DN20958_c0_g1_i5.p1 TRINITY_DN20958_c0_g1~~TRINITY_DN20958_c0_g1_i5.p1  ORF type:complete len:378 (-),score=33.41 TRINITY_DN20958_c0_g1_i5:1453-2478(-)